MATNVLEINAERLWESLERSAEMVVAVLAIIQAGAAYVPLDPEYPAERLALMMEDCDLRWVVVDREREEIQASTILLPLSQEEGGLSLIHI